MEKSKRLLILIGNDKQKHNELISSLTGRFGYKLIDLYGTSNTDFIPEKTVDEKTFLADYQYMIEPVQIGGDYYGVRQEDLLTEKSEKIVVSVPSLLVESLYAAAMRNSIAPVVISVEADSEENEQNIRQEWANKNAAIASNLSTPISLTVLPSDEIRAQDLNAVVTWTTNFLTSKIDFKELRKKSLGNGRAADLLKSIDEDAKRKYKFQKMSALALGVGLSVAGSPEMAMALMGSFFLAKESIRNYNEKTSLFKEKGFTLAERLCYFAFGSSVGTTEKTKNIYDDHEKNIIFALIDEVEKKFGDLFITSERMSAVESLYEKAKCDYFKPKDQFVKGTNEVHRAVR